MTRPALLCAAFMAWQRIIVPLCGHTPAPCDSFYGNVYTEAAYRWLPKDMTRAPGDSTYVCVVGCDSIIRAVYKVNADSWWRRVWR